MSKSGTFDLGKQVIPKAYFAQVSRLKHIEWQERL
jgi:hypothetical protein